MLKKDYKNLSKKYHGLGNKQLSKAEIESYIAARMPATLAALRAVLGEVAHRISHEVKNFLDMGAGPGTGLVAVKEFFNLEEAILVEKNPHMVAKGKELVDARWIEGDIVNVKPLDMDLVLFGYSLGELQSGDRIGILRKVWEGAKTVVIVEPGTPQGYDVVLQARKEIIRLGGNMVAPCPHTKKCPMEGTDWCHFSTRLQRTKEHKLAKGAELGWEDEKFSYVAFSKETTYPASGRVVRHPQKPKGMVSLQICGQNGLEEVIVTQKQKDAYKVARKIKWGEPFLSEESSQS